MRNNYTCNKIGRPGTDRIGRHEVLLPINHNYKKYVVFEPLLIKTQGIPKAFFSLALKKSHFNARAMARTVQLLIYLRMTRTALLHCPISAEIKTVDSQSNLRILL